MKGEILTQDVEAVSISLQKGIGQMLDDKEHFTCLIRKSIIRIIDEWLF